MGPSERVPKEIKRLKNLVLRKQFLRKFKKYKMHSTTTLRRSAEMVILTLDLFACPYISKEYKWRIASSMNVSKNNFKSILRYFRNHRSMFMRWEGVDITKELNAKVSQEVYA